jgi:cbb3-type cytochrome oxidase maturation protein
MTILYVLVPIALMLAAGAVIAFRWAVRDSQFDDLESPAVRILDDGLDANDSTAQNFRPSGEERAL